jgi:hypothetical protein
MVQVHNDPSVAVHDLVRAVVWCVLVNVYVFRVLRRAASRQYNGRLL